MSPRGDEVVKDLTCKNTFPPIFSRWIIEETYFIHYLLILKIVNKSEWYTVQNSTRTKRTENKVNYTRKRQNLVIVKTPQIEVLYRTQSMGSDDDRGTRFRRNRT